MTEHTGSTTRRHLMTIIARATIPKATTHTLRRPLIGSGAPLMWPVALGPLPVEMTTDDLADGKPGSMLWSPILLTNYKNVLLGGVGIKAAVSLRKDPPTKTLILCTVFPKLLSANCTFES